MTNYKISFCTVCMNRLEHLRATLPRNILDNKDYKYLEFVLLDYNSQDGIEDFAKRELKEYIGNGRLKYFKTTTPVNFHRAHSRNLLFKLATGELICNIDADNFTGKGFAEYINAEFNKQNNIFLTTIGAATRRDILGRICVRKKDFLNIKGYDERMQYYGFEDYDLVNRLELHKINKVYIHDNIYLEALTHGMEERIKNEGLISNLASLYLNYLSPSSTDFIFLFKDSSCRRGTLIDNELYEYDEPLTDLKAALLQYEYAILQECWPEGHWRSEEELLHIEFKGLQAETFRYQKERNCFVSTTEDVGSGFFRIFDEELIHESVMFFSKASNRILMEQNKLGKLIAVNQDTFGCDVIYSNFDNDLQILIN